MAYNLSRTKISLSVSHSKLYDIILSTICPEFQKFRGHQLLKNNDLTEKFQRSTFSFQIACHIIHHFLQKQDTYFATNQIPIRHLTKNPLQKSNLILH